MAGKKVRVYELAKRLGLANDEIIAFLHQEGVEVKSHASTVDEETAELISDLIKEKKDGGDAKGAPAAKATTAEPEPKEEPAAVVDDADTPAVSPRSAKLSPELSSNRRDNFKPKHQKHQKGKEEAKEEAIEPTVTEDGELLMRPPIVVKDLADVMDIKPNVLIMELMEKGVMAAINQKIEIGMATEICAKHGFTLVADKRGKGAGSAPAKNKEPAPDKMTFEDDRVDPRPPIVTFLGHVDHGKTSLQDKMRNTTVADGEAGKITQHIGASTITRDGHQITFIDTPGHEAFTQMRARGANVTDIAILVVAADDGFMPQTIEAMNHAKAAGVQIIVAMNKMDLPAADTEKVLRQMMENEMMPEDWGGEFGAIRVSAETGEGLDDLLERILLESEMLELKANPKLPGQAIVIESNLEVGLGATASVIVQNGTIKHGDAILCGQEHGRVKALIDYHGNRVKKAGPSMPVMVVGLNGVPKCGDRLAVCKNERQAKKLAGERSVTNREEALAPKVATSMEDLFDQMAAEAKLNLKIIVKTDVQGTCEAVCQTLKRLDSPKIRLDIIHSGVGAVNDNDVLLAAASDATVVGFHVRVNPGVNKAAKREGVDIRLYSVIYELVEQIKAAMEGKLAPELHEIALGKAKILQVFEMSNGGKICGCTVTEGTVRVKARARVLRADELIYNGDIASLRHFQDDVKEVRAGQECGIKLDNFMDFEVNDLVDVYEYKEVKSTL